MPLDRFIQIFKHVNKALAKVFKMKQSKLSFEI